MSTTCALMSTRPSSNTANSPTGPAPTMTASVLIASWDMGGSELFVGNADHEAIEPLGHLDLTGEPARRPDVESEIEHVLLHLLRAPRRFAPRIIHIDVAGRASASTATFGGDPRDRVLHRGLHHRHAGLRLDNAFRPVFLDKGDPGHDIGALRCVPSSGTGRRSRLAPEGGRREKVYPLAAPCSIGQLKVRIQSLRGALSHGRALSDPQAACRYRSRPRAPRTRFREDGDPGLAPGPRPTAPRRVRQPRRHARRRWRRPIL